MRLSPLRQVGGGAPGHMYVIVCFHGYACLSPQNPQVKVSRRRGAILTYAETTCISVSCAAIVFTCSFLFLHQITHAHTYTHTHTPHTPTTSTHHHTHHTHPHTKPPTHQHNKHIQITHKQKQQHRQSHKQRHHEQK